VEIKTGCDIGYHNGLNMAVSMAINAPAVDAVEVVRCKDCYYYGEKYPGRGYCKYFDILRIDNDFCSSGQRRDNG
jgi:hypothetical protein